MKMAVDLRIHIRDRLREARRVARLDAENYVAIVREIEALGKLLTNGDGHGLGKYKPRIKEFVGSSLEFETVFEIVRIGRNQAIHQGHIARNLVRYAVELSLIIEGALSRELEQLRFFMARDVTCAFRWQTIAMVRKAMLENAFSFLPIQDTSLHWKFLSDDALVFLLRRDSPREPEREKRLQQTVESVWPELEPLLLDADCFREDSLIADVVAQHSSHVGKPVLVLNNDDRLVGMLTAEDLL